MSKAGPIKHCWRCNCSMMAQVQKCVQCGQLQNVKRPDNWKQTKAYRSLMLGAVPTMMPWPPLA